MIFDLLWLDGHSLTQLPYRERRTLLEGLGLDGPALAGARPTTGEGATLLAAAAAQASRASSPSAWTPATSRASAPARG